MSFGDEFEATGVSFRPEKFAWTICKWCDGLIRQRSFEGARWRHHATSLTKCEGARFRRARPARDRVWSWGTAPLSASTTPKETE